MKLKLKIFALISALALFAYAPYASARHGKALEIARQMKEQTDRTVDSVKTAVESFNTDSMAQTVIYDKQDVANDNDSNDKDEDNFWGIALLIPIIAIIMGIAAPAAVVVLIAYFICKSSRQKARDKNEVVTKAIAAGYPLPEGFYKSDAPNYRLQSGIVWIGWGLGMVILFLLDAGRIWLPIGIIMSFIGLSRLAVYFVTRKNAEEKDFADSHNDAEQD